MTLTLKKRLINVGVLSAVFIVAVIIFSYVTNKGNDNMTADMGAATFPQISFSYGDYKINTLTGYAKRMDVSSMHNTITPVADQSLDVNIEAYGNKFTGASYKVYTLDGTSELESKKIKKAGKNFSLDLSGDKVLDEERILEVRLNRNGADPVYFYTRIVSDEDANVAQCLNYISDYHENALAKAENAGVGAALEPTDDADNTTLQHVTINSNYEQVTWGSLKPQVEQEERWSIKELNSTCMSVLLQYRVSCKGEENESDRYAVKEFFRVRYIADAQKTYLLDYDRTMDQIFDATKKVLNEKGIILGIAPTNLSYKVNKDGTIVSFVEANELWNYNKDSDEVSLVFGFADAENTDVRNLVPDHKIKILKVDAKGNTTFLVSGYMNRGEHEGEVGVAVYYYDIEKNSVEEKVFISTNKSYAQAVSELGEMSYYDAKTDMLYTMVDGTLYQYSIEDDEKTVLVKGLDAQQYVVSEDGSINYDRLDELIEFHCAHKTDSIVICGTTGESATMTEEEHMQCVKFTIDRVNKRVPVIAGTGSNCTRTAIDMSKEASEYGADGLLLVTPYYNKATQNGLIGHFSAVAKEVTAPIIMYSVASRTGCNIEPATVARLVKDVDNIVGIKEASGNISQVAKIMNLTDGNVDLYSGNDDQIVPVLSLGGKGVISVLSNVAPDAAHDICEKYFEGDVKGSAELQLKALPLIDQLFCEVNPIPVKKAMQLMGIDCGPLRMPLTEISPEHEKNLAQAMKDFGIQLV